MWNVARTDSFPALAAGPRMITGGNGEQIHAYIAMPEGSGPFPGVVLIHHIPGWDEFYREFARRFADHGYIAVAPNLFEQYGHGTPDDVAAKARSDGYPSDAAVVADAEAAMKWIKAQPASNGKVGVIGTCSGGRHAVLAASMVTGFDAAADLWGGNVVMAPDRISEKQPVAPIDLTPNLSAPLLGLFGNEDTSPSPEQVNLHEEALKANGKVYQFHRYDGATHGFMYYHSPRYHPQATMDGWNQIMAWFGQHLS